MIVRVPSLGGIGSTVVEEVAVKTIRSGLRLRRNYGRHRLTELRIVVLRCDLSFRDGIERWVDNDLAEDGILIGSSIQARMRLPKNAGR